MPCPWASLSKKICNTSFISITQRYCLAVALHYLAFAFQQFNYSRLLNKRAGVFINFGYFSSRHEPYLIEKIYQFLKKYNFCVEKSVICYKNGYFLASLGDFPGGTFISYTKNSIRHAYSSKHAYSIVQSINFKNLVEYPLVEKGASQTSVYLVYCFSLNLCQCFACAIVKHQFVH